jgi:hypothetical protein
MKNYFFRLNQLQCFFKNYLNSGKLNQRLRYDLYNLVGNVLYSMLKEDAINITKLYKIFQTQPDIVGHLGKT